MTDRVWPSQEYSAIPFWKRSTPKTDPGSVSAPQRPAAAPKAMPAKPVLPRKPVEHSIATREDAPQMEADIPKKGFDPYNSGAFDVRDTWGKVIRK